MAASRAFIVAVATIALVVRSAAATNFTVGAPGGSWDLQTNFASWAASKTFVAGDNLIFSYPPQGPQRHNVLEVSKASYDSCSAGGPIATHASGNDVVPLPAAATRYFICGIPGHCAAGMKVAIAVVAGGAAAPTPPPAASPSPAPSPPAPSSPPTSSSSPAPGGGSSPPPSSPPPSSGSPAPTSPPGSSALSPGGATSAPPPPGSSGANGGRSALPAEAAVGLGVGVLMMLAL
ncbi:putative mavicyanin [Iris pallida]|uniref:Mavicyanin n=1 Tax=Iris pallida TaxID=29817 RepID=A0AAX6IAB7_IRIPA|nr:putative mavicyanin [Iris pallida]